MMLQDRAEILVRLFRETIFSRTKLKNLQLIMVSLKSPHLNRGQLSKLISTEVLSTMPHLPNRLKDRLKVV